jgi:cytochrome P450
MESFATLEKHIREHPEPVFALLREVKPILVTRGFAVVTRFEDVLEILDHPVEFNVPYAPKMKAITGDFILGLDNNPQYEHDVSALRLAVKREDLDRVAHIVTGVATQIVGAAAGKLDVVSSFTDVVPARLIAEYLGVPGPDEATLIEWAHLLFDDIFNNVKNDAAITRMALAAGQEMRSYLDHLIAQRKTELASGGAGS